MATPLDDVVANIHSPGHTGFIIFMPGMDPEEGGGGGGGG